MTSEEEQLRVLGENVFSAMVDEANFLPRLLPAGTPIRHRDRHEAVGVIQSTYWIGRTGWYSVEWVSGEFATQVKATWVNELPSEMHLLAAL